MNLRWLAVDERRWRGGTYHWGLAPVIGGGGVEDCLVDAGHDAVHIIICHVGAGGEAEADLKQLFLYTIGIDRSTGIHGLLVHWLPCGASLNLLA